MIKHSFQLKRKISAKLCPTGLSLSTTYQKCSTIYTLVFSAVLLVFPHSKTGFKLRNDMMLHSFINMIIWLMNKHIGCMQIVTAAINNFVHSKLKAVRNLNAMCNITYYHRRRRWGAGGHWSYFLGNIASKFWAISCRLGKFAS